MVGLLFFWLLLFISGTQLVHSFPIFYQNNLRCSSSSSSSPASLLHLHSKNQINVLNEIAQAGDQVQEYLVHKGFRFDSFQRRFDGVWNRISDKSQGAVEFLQQAYGLSSEEATEQSKCGGSAQEFVRERVSGDGIEFSLRVHEDGGWRQEATYRLGEWNETISTPSTIVQPPPLPPPPIQRKAYWLNSNQQQQLIIQSQMDDGSSETIKRSLQSYNLLKVEKIFVNSAGETYETIEYFQRQHDDGSAGATEAQLSSLKRVPGCVANVDVFTILLPDSSIHIDGQSDAILSRGLLAIVAEYLEGLSYHDALRIDPTTIADELSLRGVLTQGRNDGLASMIRVVQEQIRDLVEETKEEIEEGTGEQDTSRATAPESSTSDVPTVAMLLSGGVDSSVALNLLTRQGYNVTAFYLKIWLEDELAHLGQCPWEDDFLVCQQICEQAGVPLEAISLQQQYKERVISYTIQEAEKGRTPNPDIMCNSRVKFGCFYDAIEGRGFDHVASGHYAQLVEGKHGVKRLLRAPDAIKDQSYFLCALTQQQLSKVLFPIGHMEKSQVRDLAHEFDLPNKHRPDSQGLCFLGKVRFDEFLQAYLGERPGQILDAATGENLGTHRGVWYHTVGQRKGIGKVLDPKVVSRGPWYVVAKDPERDVVYASNQYEEEIFEEARRDISVEDIQWISDGPPAGLIRSDGSFGVPFRFHLKIRHGPKIVEGSLTLSDATTGDVKLDHKDGGLAPGQYVVFYDIDGTECLGGGVISEKHWAKFLLDRDILSQIGKKKTTTASAAQNGKETMTTASTAQIGMKNMTTASAAQTGKKKTTKASILLQKILKK